MINKENNDQDDMDKKIEDGYVDVANMAVECHLVIKDKDTDEVLLDKRG